VMRAILICLLLTSCSAYDAALLPLPRVCLWRSVGAVDSAVGADTGQPCYRVTAPEHARVSPVELDACDAEELGLETVTVQRGETVWRYSEPNLAGAGTFKTRWVNCGD
jgi:hypothetical protein